MFCSDTVLPSCPRPKKTNGESISTPLLQSMLLLRRMLLWVCLPKPTRRLQTLVLQNPNIRLPCLQDCRHLGVIQHTSEGKFAFFHRTQDGKLDPNTDNPKAISAVSVPLSPERAEFLYQPDFWGFAASQVGCRGKRQRTGRWRW